MPSSDHSRRSNNRNGGLQLVSSARYESGPMQPHSTEVDADTIAVKKQEEIVKKKKVEYTTTKQIETRVKRHVMLEDGQIVADSGPLVTTNTTEDTETKEEEQKEHKKSGEDPPTSEGWMAIPGAVIVREKTEKKTKTRDEIEEKLETEEAHHLGDLTNDDIVRAIRDKSDVRLAITRRRNSDSSSGQNRHEVVPLSNKKIVHQSRKHKRYVDQEDTQEKSEEKDGRIVTETTRHEHHEEFDDEEVPDDEVHSHPSSVHEITKETKKNYTHVKDDDQIEYLLVPPDGKLSDAVKLGQGHHLTSEVIQHDRQGEPITDAGDKEWESLSARIRKNREALTNRKTREISAVQGTPAAKREPSPERKDALTKEPLDLEAEEETRKLETSRWLESHFGSESSRSSHNDPDNYRDNDFENKMPSQVSSGGISVTMTSAPKFQSHSYDEVDSMAAPAPPPPPPMPTNEPLSRPRAFSPPANENVPSNNSSVKGTGKVITSGRYAGYSDRVQVLPVGPGKTFFNNSASTPPQSPIYKSGSFLNGNNNSTYGSPVPKDAWQSSSSKITHQDGDIYTAPVKRSTSFNSAAKPVVPPWKKTEDSSTPSNARESIKGVTSLPRTTSMREEYRHSFNEVKEDKPVLKNIRQWPPPKVDDEDQENEQKSWKYQPKATVIRLGPQNEVEEEPIQRRKTFYTGNNSFTAVPPYPNGASVSRSKSMLLPTNPYRTEERAQNQLNTQYREKYAVKSSSQLNLARTSPPRRSSPEDLIPERETPYFQKHVKSPIVYETKQSAKSPPPPRPAPPSFSQSERSQRYDNSYESKRIYASPTFADQLRGPPVRPERRKAKLRPKTDSGTQTIRHEMNTQTLDRPKPKKKFYLGEDPFTGNVPATKTATYSTYATMGHPKNEAKKEKQFETEQFRSQTLPRKPQDQENPKKFFFGEYNGKEKDSVNVSAQDRSLNETYGGSMVNVNQSLSSLQKTPAKYESSTLNPPSSANVSRSQSFNVRSVNAPKTLFAPKPLNSIEKESKYNSPLYKSSPFLNKSVVESSAPLKSPGIVTTISRSQLDLKQDDEPLVYSSSLFTLPRKRSDRLRPESETPTPNLARSQSAVNRSAADRVVSNQVSNGSSSRQSLSSLHYAKTTPKTSSPANDSGMTFQSSTKATHRSFLSDTSQKQSESPSEFPRVVSGKAKGPAPPPPPKTYAQPRSPETNSPDGDGKRQQFLRGLLNTAPELFMHIHGDEDLSKTKLRSEDVMDGKNNSRYHRPSPPDSPPPPLTRPGSTPKESLYTPVNKVPRTNLNRVYTSTPVLNKLSSADNSTSKYNSSFRTIQEEQPRSPPPSLSKAGDYNSMSLVRADTTPRRGSLTPSGSMVIRPLLKIPAPENYSETTRIKSSGKPDDKSHTETDSVQTFSKRVVPLKDGFSSETVEEKTTVTKSHFKDNTGRDYNGQYAIRPQHTGGVIIQVRDRKGSR